MNHPSERRERPSRFTLGRATVLAVALHLLFGAAVTIWPGLLTPAQVMASPEEPPLEFRFVDTPETEPPPEPPDTEVLSDIDRQAVDNAEPTPENTPFSEGNTVAEVIRPTPQPSEASEASEAAQPTPEPVEPATEQPQPEEVTEEDPAETSESTDSATETPAEEAAEVSEDTAPPTATQLPPRRRNLRRSLAARPESFVDPQVHDNREGGVGGDRAMAQFDTRGYDLGAYLSEVLRKIETNWRSNMPPLIQTGIGGATFVNLSIRRERNAAGEEVAMIIAEHTYSSGQPAYDSAAVFALELSNALPAIPDHYPHEAITGRLGFIYNLDPQSVVFPEDR